MSAEIIHLFRKYLSNKCSSEELDKVLQIIGKGEHLAEWESVLAEEANNISEGNLEAEVNQRELINLHERIQHTITVNPGNVVPYKGKHNNWLRIAAAAVVFLVLGTSFYLYKNRTPAFQTVKVKPANDIAPGGNKAVLTLADGKKIVLTDAQTGQIAEQSGIKVAKTTDGQIVFTVASAPGTSSPTGYNTIETPKGGQYQIYLPDGTKVWLNAASSIRFPVNFAASERRVELKGEAYFEVAHNKAVPFRVSSANQLIEVLGTHFNVNAYEDESSIKTTLLEGSVKVQANTSHFKILKPGQQSTLSAGKLSAEEVDTELAVAWKNNVFMFDHDDIEHIMRMVTRWYNVDVVYIGEVPTDTFGGSVSKFDNVSEVLKTLELTGKVHFKIQGRRIIVTK